MKLGTFSVILIAVILAGSSCATLPAQDATVISDTDACTEVLSYLSSGGFMRDGGVLIWGSQKLHMQRITGGELAPSGIRFQLKGRPEKEVLLDFKDFVDVSGQDTQIFFRKQEGFGMNIDLSKLHGFWSYTPTGLVDARLVPALNKLVSDAHAGYPYDCHGALTPADAAKVFADFQEKVAAWRAMNPKPPVSDEVTRKRLLAEDAVQEKDFAAAGNYYRAGITIDPTWAPGWYNAALISAELKDYSAAANYMKHYLILLPDAPDAAAAKEKLLLWEAKAEEAGGK